MLYDHALRLYVRATIAPRMLWQDRKGGDFIEYALIGGVTLLFVGGLVWQFGGKLATLWQRMIAGMR